MFRYFILIHFLSHKLADSVKDDFKHFAKGILDFFAVERGVRKKCKMTKDGDFDNEKQTQ